VNSSPKSTKRSGRKTIAHDPYNPDCYPNEVWVHPDLGRVLKGSDQKYMTDEALQYWFDRQRQKAAE
jgi:hypothetical protein